MMNISGMMMNPNTMNPQQMQQHQLQQMQQHQQMQAQLQQQHQLQQQQQHLQQQQQQQQMQQQNLMQQQQQQQQMQQQQQQQQQMQQGHDAADPIVKFKRLVPRLKDTLLKLIATATQNFVQNVNVDNCLKTGDVQAQTSVPRFEKLLEDFYCICDQMEMHLRLAIDVLNQSSDSQRYLPLVVQASALPPPTPQAQQETASYPQYLVSVRLQLSAAKELHDTLVGLARSIGPSDKAILPSPKSVGLTTV